MSHQQIQKASDEGAFLFCDTHCHLDDLRLLSQLDIVLDGAYQKGVREILVPSVGVWNWERVLNLTQSCVFLYPALGLHPIYISRHDEAGLQSLESLLASNSCTAIGEIGLDFSLPDDTRGKQEKFFIEQLELANRYRLPVSIHSRKSQDFISKILKAHRPEAGGAIHGFTGSYEQAKRFVDLGMHIGVGGSITYPRAAKTRSAIARLPVDTLLLETDSPDMPVCGYQGQINTPAKVREIFSALTDLKNENSLDMCNRLRKISRNLFSLKKRQ